MSWLDAISDIQHTLPDSQFAPWQVPRLPEWYKQSILVRGSNTKQERGDGFRAACEPAHTLDTHGTPKAFLMPAGNATTAGAVTGAGSAPVFAGHASGGARAFLIGGGNTNKTEINSMGRDGEAPSFTISPASDRDRAYVGRVVKMTKQALQRFQTIPDWYQGATMTIIGNAVPARFTEVLGRHILEEVEG